jgi:Na+-translocating ferredoxin:NAD+ oxidoreductase RnfG subunit
LRKILALLEHLPINSGRLHEIIEELAPLAEKIAEAERENERSRLARVLKEHNKHHNVPEQNEDRKQEAKHLLLQKER